MTDLKIAECKFIDVASAFRLQDVGPEPS